MKDRSRRDYFIMLFNFYGFYVLTIECSINNIEMVEDDHLHKNTKNTRIWQMIISKLSAQCVIMIKRRDF